MHNSVENAEILDQIEAHQPNWQTNSKERDLCAGIKEDCSASKCCKITGQKCISSGGAKPICAETCAKGKNCTVISDTITLDTKERTSLFCFTVYTENTGSTK